MKYYNITVNGVAYSVSVERNCRRRCSCCCCSLQHPSHQGRSRSCSCSQGSRRCSPIAVKAPMPGNILDVKVAAGASVKAGDVLVILEAMKMENEIVAPQDGTVASINVNKGDTVNSGDVLVSMN